MNEISCRSGCGACCIAPSISSPIPGMPHGKPAGVRCIQLSADNRCMIFGKPERPEVCRSLRPTEEMCGTSTEEAMRFLVQLELATEPRSNTTYKYRNTDNMPDYLTSPIDYTEPSVVSAIDDLSLWSSRFGAMMLDNLEVRPNIRGLDVGCGAGFPLIELANIHGDSCRFTGVDVWESAIERGREKIRVHGLHNVEIVSADAASLPFDDSSFDLIVSNLGINNFAHPHAVLAECARVTCPQGRIALTTNVTGHMQEFYRIYRETLVELEMDWYLEPLEHQEQHRGNRELFTEWLEQAGYGITRILEDRFTLRYLNGSAFLRHWFIRLGFLGGWRSFLESTDEEVVFSTLERNLNAMAELDGELRLSVPMLYIEGTLR